MKVNVYTYFIAYYMVNQFLFFFALNAFIQFSFFFRNIIMYRFIGTKWIILQVCGGRELHQQFISQNANFKN